MPKTTDGGTVAIWRADWLPASETFIRDQLGALTRWTPLRLGVRALDGGLPPLPDHAPFRHGYFSRVLFRLFRLRGRLGGYAAAMERSGALLLHAHFGTDAVFALPLVARTGLPFVVTFHGMDATRAAMGTSRRARAYRRRLPELFERATLLVAVSEFTAGRLRELGAPPEKIRVRLIGVPVPDAAALVRRPAPGAPTILFVGRLVEKKGVDDLIAAVALLPADVAPVRLVVVGDGPLRAALEASARELGVDADFRGTRSSDEVREAMLAASIFCAPCKTARDGDSEGVTLTVQEAATCGVPVVATRHGGIPEFVRDGVNGVLVGESDPAALAGALAGLLRDPERAAELAAAGRKRVEEEFDVVGRTAELERVYDEALALAREG